MPLGVGTWADPEYAYRLVGRVDLVVAPFIRLQLCPLVGDEPDVLRLRINSLSFAARGSRNLRLLLAGKFVE